MGIFLSGGQTTERAKGFFPALSNWHGLAYLFPDIIEKVKNISKPGPCRPTLLPQLCFPLTETCFLLEKNINNRLRLLTQTVFILAPPIKTFFISAPSPLPGQCLNRQIQTLLSLSSSLSGSAKSRGGGRLWRRTKFAKDHGENTCFYLA